MKMIQISKDTLINPSMISVIETRTTKNGKSIKVFIEGQSYLVEISPGEFFSELLTSGVEAHQQFFAG